MLKFFTNFLFFLIVLSFFFKIFEFYNSNVYIDRIIANRGNIEKLILEKNPKIPILKNDTDNVIEFNSGFQNEEKKLKRKFWDLFKKWKEKLLS